MIFVTKLNFFETTLFIKELTHVEFYTIKAKTIILWQQKLLNYGM